MAACVRETLQNNGYQLGPDKDVAGDAVDMMLDGGFVRIFPGTGQGKKMEVVTPPVYAALMSHLELEVSAPSDARLQGRTYLKHIAAIEQGEQRK